MSKSIDISSYGRIKREDIFFSFLESSRERFSKSSENWCFLMYETRALFESRSNFLYSIFLDNYASFGDSMIVIFSDNSISNSFSKIFSASCTEIYFPSEISQTHKFYAKSLNDGLIFVEICLKSLILFCSYFESCFDENSINIKYYSPFLMCSKIAHKCFF